MKQLNRRHFSSTIPEQIRIVISQRMYFPELPYTPNMTSHIALSRKYLVPFSRLFWLAQSTLRHVTLPLDRVCLVCAHKTPKIESAMTSARVTPA